MKVGLFSVTHTNRIALNVFVTYGRSLYALALGLFTARWALEALGAVDYGLFGLVGGLISLVGFINNILAFAVRRFYAVNIGAAQKCGNEIVGLEECRRWFNVALSLHTLLPFFLMLIGYPLGIWAVENFLVIPADRVVDCVWVWRFSCVACFVTIANVPFSAMYTAKQEIAELTLFSLISTTGKAILLYYMVTHPGIWLSKYSFGVCAIGAIPQILLASRALLRYPECKVKFDYWFDVKRYKQLGKFAAAGFWSDFSGLISGQGQAVLVNKYTGPVFNASMAIGNSVAAHASTLSSSLSAAFSPVVGNLYGAGRIDEMRRFCLLACRAGGVLVLLFAIPVALEIREILNIWLVNPPEFAAEICVIALVRIVLDRMTDGYWMGIYSKGYKVVKYSWAVGWAGISTVVVSWICFSLGLGMWSIVIGISVSKFLLVVVRIVYGKMLLDFEIFCWIKKVFLPIFAISFVTVMVGLIVRELFCPSFIRILSTTLVCELVFIPLVWLFMLENGERNFAITKIRAIIHI